MPDLLIDLYNLYRVEVLHITSVILALAIWRWGAAPERWLIGIFIATMVAPLYLSRWLGLGSLAFGPYAWIYVGVDLLATIGFLAVALNANRNYPLWVAGFQLVSVSAHAVRGLGDMVSPFAYLFLAVGPSYCQLLLIGAGFIRHARRERRFGSYRDWRVTRDRPPLFQS
jgi:hypothetical protein